MYKQFFVEAVGLFFRCRQIPVFLDDQFISGCCTAIKMRTLCVDQEGGMDKSNLKRPIHKMPQFVKQALTSRGLMEAYRERPAYQQNDYIGWINRAKREETRQKRLNQMLDELDKGGIYMKMKHPASDKG